MWLNFKYCIAGIVFGVIITPERKWAVCEEQTAQELNVDFLKTSENHTELDYDQIRHIKMDADPLPFWEELTGVFATMDGELLRYILHSKIPLEKLIRFELAARGYDENHHWCGFDKAEEIWLNDN